MSAVLLSGRGIKRIYINRHVIAANAKVCDARRHPPVTVACAGQVTHGTRVRVFGPSEVIYRPEKPLKCGATVWIETKAVIELTS